MDLKVRSRFYCFIFSWATLCIFLKPHYMGLDILLACFSCALDGSIIQQTGSNAFPQSIHLEHTVNIFCKLIYFSCCIRYSCLEEGRRKWVKIFPEAGSFTCVFCGQLYVSSFSNCNQMGRRLLPPFRKYLLKPSSISTIKTTLNVEFHFGISLS